jgi:hypothetical protein
MFVFVPYNQSWVSQRKPGNLKPDDVTENLEPFTYIHYSPYFDDRELIQLAKQHANTFFILSMNCQCL